MRRDRFAKKINSGTACCDAKCCNQLKDLQDKGKDKEQEHCGNLKRPTPKGQPQQYKPYRKCPFDENGNEIKWKDRKESPTEPLPLPFRPRTSTGAGDDLAPSADATGSTRSALAAMPIMCLCLRNARRRSIAAQRGTAAALPSCLAAAGFLSLPGCARDASSGNRLEEGYIYQTLGKPDHPVPFPFLKDEYELYRFIDFTFDAPDFVSQPCSWPQLFVGYVHKGGNELWRRVWEYSSFGRTVKLSSPADAVSLFRFFSTWDGWFYTPIGEFEVFPEELANVGGERAQWIHDGYVRSPVPGETWRAAGLSTPGAEWNVDHYEVTRFILTQNGAGEKLHLFRVVERIGAEGEGYQRLAEEEVVPTPAFVQEMSGLPSCF